ncbi:unnamed protein product [Schistosoma turkestanicum]|nr:unnamed protein product [Schistosoma turkestanicum]
MNQKLTLISVFKLVLALIILESFLYTKQKAIANINLHHATFLILNDMYNEIYNMRKNNSGSFVN